MPENAEKSLSKEKVAVVTIEGAVFPTIEDEILGITNYTAYVPFSEEIKTIIAKSKNPFKLKVNLSSPKNLSDGETHRIRALFLEKVKSYEGDLEMKKRLRIKGLKISSLIEVGFLAGLFYSSLAIGYGVSIGIVRFVAEFVFWGGLIFIPSVIGPAIGGLRYWRSQKGLERLEENLRDVEFSIKTDDNKIHEILDVYSKIDDIKIYEKMGLYAEKVGYKLAQGFYQKLTERLSPEESLVTKYLPAGFKDSIKAMFDIRVEAPDFYSPIGEVEE